MSRLEIPSIVVHNGSSSAPSSPTMEQSARPARTLSKQESLVDDECDEGVEEGDQMLHACPDISSHSLPSSTPSPPTSSPQQSSSPQGPGPGGGCCSPVPHIRSESLELLQQKSSDSQKDSTPPVTSVRHRHHGAKLKLLQRSHAMREDTSPPPDIQECAHLSSSHGNTLTVVGPAMGGVGLMGNFGNKRRLRQQGSSQGSSFDGSSPCLSRDSSTEYTDSSGVDLLQFIIQTLHKNQKDRMMLLKIERELISLVKDGKRTHHKFPQMSSYQRMLVHRCAAYFGLDHNVDQAGTSVIVNKTCSTRLPETRFRDHCRDEILPADEPKRSILRREFLSFDDAANLKYLERYGCRESRRSKSFEEREEEYERAKKRIFNEESFSSVEGIIEASRLHESGFEPHMGLQDEVKWHDHRGWSFLEADAHHRKHFDNHRLRPGRLPKVESFESRETLHPRCLRPPVFKSHSFDSSSSSRYSEQSSSSGYKTQRQDTSSTNVSNTFSTTPSPTACPHIQPPFGQGLGTWNGDNETQPVMWAVTDMEAVPAGAILINPQSGQPYLNSDGTIYRYDPNNPPHLAGSTAGKAGSIDDSLESESNKDKDGLISPASPPDIEGFSPASASSPSKPSPSPQQQSSPDLPPKTHMAAVSAKDYVDSDELIAPKDIKSEKRDKCSTDDEHSCKDGRSAQSSNTIVFPQVYHHSQENVMSDVGSHFRTLSLSASSGLGEVASPSIMPTHQVQPGYVLPRQQFSQPIYYVPPATVSSLSGGGIKYVYPQYQVAPMQGPSSITSPSASALQASTNMQGAVVAQMQPSTNVLPAVHSVPTLSGMAAALPPSGSTSEPPGMLQPGFVPGSYAVVAYQPAGFIGGPNTGSQESTNAAYFCPISGAPAPIGAVPAGSSLQQFPIAVTSTSSGTFPSLNSNVGYCANSGHSAYPGSVLPTNVLPGGAYAPTYMPPSSGPTSGVAYRTVTPPISNTQGMTMSIGIVVGEGGPNSSLSATAGVGGQYITIMPSSVLSPSPSHSQVYSAYYNSIQQLRGTSSNTSPPAQPLLQLAGTSTPVVNHGATFTSHPPVFAKPYVAPSSHTFFAAGGADDATKRYLGGVRPTTTGQFFGRPYSFLPNDHRPLPTQLGSLSSSSIRSSGTPHMMSGENRVQHLYSPPVCFTSLLRTPRSQKARKT